MYHIFLGIYVFFIMGLPFSLFVLKNKKLNLLEVIAMTTVLGPLLTTFAVLGLGYVGWLSWKNMIIISIAITGLPLLSDRVRAALLSVRHINRFSFSSFLSTFSSLDITSLSVIVTVFAITAPSAFTLPPVLRDPYAVWLFYGKKIWETRTIPLFYGNAPDISWSGNYPPLISFLTAYYFMVLNSISPEIFTHVSWVYGALTVLVVFALTRELELKRGAVFSALLLTTSSIFTLELINYGYTDTALAFYVVLAYYYLVKLMHEHTMYNGALFGLCLGAALLAKYLALIFVLTLVIYAISIRVLKRTKQLPIKPFLIGLSVAFAIVLPWITRNLLLLGNPIYPWFYQLIGGKSINNYVMEIVPKPRYEISRLFIDNTFTGLALEDIGYTLLIFGLLGFFLAKMERNSKIKELTDIAIFHFLIVLVFMTTSYGYERYLLQVLPVMAVFGSYMIVTVFSKKNLMLTVVVLSCVLFFSLPNYAFLIHTSFQPPSSGETFYLSVISNYINEYLPVNVTVLTNEIQLFFLDRETIAVYNIPELFMIQQAEEVTDVLKSYRVTHVLINLNIDYEVIDHSTPLFKTLDNDEHFETLLEYGPYIFYEMKKIE